MINLKSLITEESIKPGSKEYFKRSMNDKEILSLADTLGSYPHTKLRGAASIQIFFRDLGNLLGLPTNPTDILTYTDGKPYLDKKKMKMNVRKAPLFQMYKDNKLSMSEYGEIQKKVFSRYLRVATLFIGGLNWSKL